MSITNNCRHLMKTLRLFGALSFAFILVISSLVWVRSGEGTVVASELPRPVALRGAVKSEPDLVVPIDSAITKVHEDFAERFPTGWQTVDGQRRYVVTGKPFAGELVTDGVTFALDEQGYWISTRLDAPYLSQLPDMPSGCEVVSVTMLLNHAGVAVTKEEVAAVLPYADDPAIGFNGSLYDDGSYSTGGVIYPSALVDLLRFFKGSAVDLTGAPWEDICSYLEAGRPVCVWFTSASLDHTVLLVGYSDTTVWVNDPLQEKDVELDIDTFMTWWSANGNRALSY